MIIIPAQHRVLDRSVGLLMKSEHFIGLSCACARFDSDWREIRRVISVRLFAFQITKWRNNEWEGFGS